MSQNFPALILHIVTLNTYRKTCCILISLSVNLFAYLSPNLSLESLKIAFFPKFVGCVVVFLMLSWFLVFVQ